MRKKQPIDITALPLKAVEELHMVLTPPISISPNPDQSDRPMTLVDKQMQTPEEICIQHDEHQHRRKVLNAFEASLNTRDSAIFHDRILGDATLKVLGEQFDVSRERIRQLENSILDRLREHLGVPTKTLRKSRQKRT